MELKEAEDEEREGGREGEKERGGRGGREEEIMKEFTDIR